VYSSKGWHIIMERLSYACICNEFLIKRLVFFPSSPSKFIANQINKRNTPNKKGDNRLHNIWLASFINIWFDAIITRMGCMNSAIFPFKLIAIQTQFTHLLDQIRSESSQIICLNLREFKQVIVRYHLWDPLDQIKIRLSNHLI
jgi:hypothetical protein